MKARSLAVSDTCGRHNNLHLLRIIFALAVIYGHTTAIFAGPRIFPPISWLTHNNTYCGALAVNGFFAISGFLVARSYYYNPNLLHWIYSRIFRIYPALWVCLVVLIVYIYFLYNSGISFIDYATDEDTVSFIKNNFFLTNVKFHLPNAFPDAKTHSVNGSLWTLPGEMRVYLLFFAIALLGLAPNVKQEKNIFGVSREASLSIVIGIILLISFFAPKYVPFVLHHKNYIAPTRCFLIGVFFFQFRKHIIFDYKIAIGLIVILSMLIDHKELFLFVFWPSVVYMTFYAAYGLPDVRYYELFGDYSYGVYIYGWFVQQIVASWSFIPNGYVHAAVSMALALVLAWASWNLIEKPALKAPKYLTSATPKLLASAAPNLKALFGASGRIYAALFRR